MEYLHGKWIFQSEKLFFLIYFNKDNTFSIIDSNVENPLNLNNKGYVYLDNGYYKIMSNTSDGFLNCYLKNKDEIKIINLEYDAYFKRINSLYDNNPKVAFITAIYGLYELECHPFIKQTIPTDFICFTNLSKIKSNGWIIDNTEYHNEIKSPVDSGKYKNSIKNNKHTFNICKFYKQNFYCIPRLFKYDYIIWLDGTIQINNENVSTYIIDKLKDNLVITGDHYRTGKYKLLQEVQDSNYFRYTSTYWFNQPQPYQDIFQQFSEYINDGYNDEDYWVKINNRETYGLWITCFCAYNINKKETIDFLNFWYLQTLKYTTQDQIGFVYACQKLKVHPYSFPDDYVKGNNNLENTLYIKNNHYRKFEDK
jgi:hypothetical protein